MNKPVLELEVIGEAGLYEALYGLGMSHGVTSGMAYDGFCYEATMAKAGTMDKPSRFDRMVTVADKLAMRGKGHNKFLESIVVWIAVNAPRYWWQEMDTYRVGVTKQSESTMHTLTKRPVDNYMFEGAVHPDQLEFINDMMKTLGNDGGPTLWEIKAQLPEGFLQKRVICTNYKALQGMYWQRKNHRLPHWPMFFEQLFSAIQFPRWIHGNNQEA
jgi:hypothetical protein